MFIGNGRIGQRRALRSIRQDMTMLEQIKKLLEQLLAPQRPAPLPVPVPVRTPRRRR
jgi:hypothetical protein